MSELKGGMQDDVWIDSEATLIRVGNTLGRPTSVYLYDFNMDWIEKEKKMNVSDDTAFVSSNDIVTSWMLNLVKANIGTIVCNYRNRIKEITDSFAGNYVTMIIYQSPDYESPKLIR